MSLEVPEGDRRIINEDKTFYAGPNPVIEGELQTNGVFVTTPVPLRFGRILDVSDETTIDGTRSEASAEVTGSLTVTGTLTLNDTANPARNLDSSTAQGVVGLFLEAIADDAEAAPATLQRLRSLIAQGSDPSEVSSAELIAGLILRASASDPDTADLLATRTRALLAESSDAEEGLVDLGIRIILAATATDADSLASGLRRVRLLDADATNPDSATLTAERIRLLASDSSDADSATTTFLPISDATDPREAARDLLNGGVGWTYERPEIDLIEDVPPKSRENRADPAIYIYNSDEGIDRFSANTTELEETTTIRLDVWTLAGATEAKAYRDDIVTTFKQYMRDNYNRTEFLDIEPSDAVDIRQTKISRQTDHYIYSVELEFERLA